MTEFIDYASLKRIPRNELEMLVPAGFTFKTDPWDHQLASFLASISADGMNEWLDLGTGKTKVAIDVVRYFEWVKRRKWRVLVICLSTAMYKWADEVLMHSDSLPIVLDDKIPVRWDRIQQCRQEPAFYITNYEGIRLMMTKRVARKNNPSKRYETIDQSKIGKMCRLPWDCLIIDESHKIKNPNAVTFRVLNRISQDMSHRMNLTGTPFGKSLLDLWSQYYIVDRGATFGKQFSYWRDANFVDKGWFGPDYKVTKAGERRIKAAMFRRAIRYEEREIKGMPPKIYETLKYKLSSEQRTRYDQALQRLGPFKDIANRTMIFRQICGGIIVKSEYIFKDNPKLDLLRDVVESVVDEYKIVIFHEFVLEGQIINQMLKKMKVRSVSLNGKVPKSKKWPGVKAFQDDDRTRVMVAHPASGGASLDFNCAHYCIFYSNGHNPLDRAQCEKRIHRGKIKRRRFYYDLIGTGTVEVGMHRSLMNDADMFKGIMNRKQLMKALTGE